MAYKSKEIERLYHQEYYKKNKLKHNKKAAEYYIRIGKIKARERMFNLSLADYNKLFDLQNGLCLGCYRHQSTLKRPLSIDHNHTCCPTKRSCGKCIRGLLCNPCNVVLGHVKDNIITLRRLADYLER